MVARAHLDFETRSPVDLRTHGAARYAQDPETEVLCARYRFDGEDTIHGWRQGDPPPARLVEAVAAGCTIVAHNAMFELFIWHFICGPRLGWGPISPYQMECTMARAQAMALPSSLDEVARVLGLVLRKDTDGYALMLQMCKPLDAREVKRRGLPAGEIHYHDTPEARERLFQYCGRDVEVESLIDNRVPPLSARETEIYHFDLVVNLRGFRLDTALMRRAEAFKDEAKRQIDERIFALTDGDVPKSTSVDKLKDWLRWRSIPVDGLRKADLEDIGLHARMFDDDVAMEVVTLRRAGAKATSLAKYGSGLRCAGFDERARGLLNYHRASTGRWAGSLYQPHNLERIDPDRDSWIVAEMIEILKSNTSAAEQVIEAGWLGLSPMAAIGKCTRAMIVAAPGHDLVSIDFSNVEGRGSAWLAREGWKLDAFKATDAGTGADMYRMAYASSFGVPLDSFPLKGPERQIGKVQELALGYQGAVGAFMSMAAGYGIKPANILAAVRPIAERGAWEKAASKFERMPQFGLDIETWTALRYVVDGWRAAHPSIVQGWWDMQDAVIAAVETPGEFVRMLGGRIRFFCARDRRFLHMYLPSGRVLSYFQPRIVEPKRKDEDTDEAEAAQDHNDRRRVVVEGRDGKRGGKWGKVSLYGGLEWENAVQALCRDLLADGMLACEEAGYPVVLHVHDEPVFEIPKGAGDVEDIRRILTTTRPWAAGFPLVTGKPSRGERYEK